jgi:hypothetical protein
MVPNKVSTASWQAVKVWVAPPPAQNSGRVALCGSADDYLSQAPIIILIDENVIMYQKQSTAN